MSVETKNHVHIQNSPYRFDVNTYAPSQHSNGRGRFSICVSHYVTGSGWDALNPKVAGNEIVEGIANLVSMYEAMGYQHVGMGSSQIREWMKNTWKQ